MTTTQVVHRRVRDDRSSRTRLARAEASHQDLFDRATGEAPGDERSEACPRSSSSTWRWPQHRPALSRPGPRPRGSEQTACLALVRAVEHFDADRGHDFLSYAVPSIRGEVMKYFRDLGWIVVRHAASRAPAAAQGRAAQAPPKRWPRARRQGDRSQAGRRASRGPPGPAGAGLLLTHVAGPADRLRGGLGAGRRRPVRRSGFRRRRDAALVRWLRGASRIAIGPSCRCASSRS